MKNRRPIARALGWALMCMLLLGCASAEEALPQMVKVNFPEGRTIALPFNPKDNYAASEDGFSADRLSYHDDTIDVQVHQIRVYDTPVSVAFVQIADASQLKTEQAKPYPSKTTVRASEIAKRVKAVLAVNADWFTYHGAGIVYRNGEMLRNHEDTEYDGLAIDINGDFHIVRPMTEAGYAALTVPVAQSFVFGPALVIDGEVQEIVNRKVTYKQRMAVGQIAPLCYVLAAADGPDQKNSVGLSVPQLAELMYNLGAQTAYNLDGGQSTTMLMGLVKVNGQNPKSIRAVGDILYFTTGVPNP